MKKQQNNSAHAWALLVAVSVALLSISAVLLAGASFRATPATRGLSAFSAPAAAGHKEPTLEQLASIPSLPAVDAPFTFNNTGSLTTARLIHTATLLNNGKVLVAGGTPDFNTPLSSAELYDSASGTWTATGSLNTARFFHTATLLPNGKVLVAGGTANGSGNGLSSAELYDPASGTWSATGNLNTARSAHTATLLPNGKVLVTGGQGTGGGFLTSAELYDPSTGSGLPRATSPPHATITRRHCCPTARCWWQGEMMAVATVLAARNCTTRPWGRGPPQAASPHAGLTRRHCCPTARCWWQGELIPAANLPARNCTTRSAGCGVTTGSLNTARSSRTAPLLSNGKVLVAGGYNGDNISSAELYDPVAGVGVHRQPQHWTLLSHGDVAAQRPGAGGSGI